MAEPAEAGVISGIGRILNGILYVPIAVLRGTAAGPPVIGTVLGALEGVVGGAVMVTQGTLDTAISGVGVAKRLAPYIIPFVL